MKKMMTSDDEKNVKEMIIEGKTPVEVSKLLNINYNSVYYFVKKTGFYKRCHKYTPEETRYLIENYDKMSVKEISKKLNISVMSIYNKARSLKLSRYGRE